MPEPVIVPAEPELEQEPELEPESAADVEAVSVYERRGCVAVVVKMWGER